MPRIDRFVLAFALCTTSLSSCVDPSIENGNEEILQEIHAPHHDFIAIDRQALQQRSSGVELPVKVAQLGQDFLIAIHRSALNERFFLSGFLDAAFPTKRPGSLGTRVVKMKEQNGRLYIINADNRKNARTDFPTQEIIDALPILSEFKGISISSLFPDHLVVDPDTALNQLSLIANPLAATAGKMNLEPHPFDVELSFSEDYRTLPDGMSFRKVLSGHARDPLDSALPDTLPTSMSATVSISLRRYQESPGFVPLRETMENRFFLSPIHTVPDQKEERFAYVARRHLYPGMKPIHWELSSWAKEKASQPTWQGFDVFRAVKRAIDSWNQAIGFEAMTLGWASHDHRLFGQDDRNYIFLDRDPRSSVSFANLRTNPNTGEIRGASIVVSGGWQTELDHASNFPNHVDHEQVSQFQWLKNQTKTPCHLDLAVAMQGIHEDIPIHHPNRRAEELARIENVITETVAHELGHTLGIRHNFKASMSEIPSSVMDYLTAKDVQRVVDLLPLPEDAQLARFLVDPTQNPLPYGPFCTDEDIPDDANCDYFDQGPYPVESAIEEFLFYINYLSAQEPRPWNEDDRISFHRIARTLLRQLRFGWLNDATRVKDTIIANMGVPVPPETANDPLRAYVVDRMMTEILTRLYLPEKLPATIQRADEDIKSPRIPDFEAVFTQQGQAILENQDRIRSWASRRRAVSVLKRMQSPLARIALVKARGVVQAQLDMEEHSAVAATQLEDLLTQVDRALDPYFEDRGSLPQASVEPSTRPLIPR